MKTKLFLSGIIIALVLGFTACGPTDEDLQMEEDILGYWQARDKDGDPEVGIPLYYFDTDHKGFTSIDGSKQDEMKWEIVRRQLKVYYDKAPKDYMVGHDKYNSRSLFQIQSLSHDKLEMTIFYYDGFQSDLDFYRIEYNPE